MENATDLLNVSLDEPSKQAKYVLWRFYDKQGALLYATLNVNQAVLKTKDWWIKAVRADIKHFATLGAAVDAKQEAIDDENAIHNKYGKSDSG
jgi:hypothetical protein